MHFETASSCAGSVKNKAVAVSLGQPLRSA